MHTTEPFTPTASGPPTLGDMAAEILPLVGAIYQAGPPVLLAGAGTVLFALMLAGPFALLVTLVVAVAAVAALVTLAGAILATPFLLIRHFARRFAERHQVSRAERTAKRPAIAALAGSMTARASR